MRKISVIGSGIIGLLAGHGLLKLGHDVTIYSALSAQDWLDKARPTGAVARVGYSRDFEAELGLNHWDDVAPPIQGLHMTICVKPDRQFIDQAGRFTRPNVSVDVRLQSSQWSHDFEQRGGKLVVGQVDVARLEQIAAISDLTLVAVGGGPLSELFERDEKRSVFDKPQRKLAMAIVNNVPLDRKEDGIPFNPVKYNLMVPWGEQFTTPFWHKDGYACWAVLFEARPGSPLDVFDGCTNGGEVVDRARESIRKVFPWEYRWFKNARLADPNSWLIGSRTPFFKKPVAMLPSGRPVMALGDTANTFDPIGGQGANSGYRQVQVLLKAVVNHGDREFDENFMYNTFDHFYETSGRVSNALNNMLLGELPAPALSLLMAQYGSNGREGNHSPAQQIADKFIQNFEDPNRLTPAMFDTELANKLIKETYGMSPALVQWRSKLRVAVGQWRQSMGLPRSSHPLATMKAVSEDRGVRRQI